MITRTENKSARALTLSCRSVVRCGNDEGVKGEKLPKPSHYQVIMHELQLVERSIK